MTELPQPVWLEGAMPLPDPRHAPADGPLAIGGTLSKKRLLEAYRAGIFPWYEEGLPVLWWSPDPRFLLDPASLVVRRSVAQRIRSGVFEVRYDTAFERVMRGCAETPRKHEAGTWITPDMIEAYCGLFDAGTAHSVECWKDDELVGGLYGVSLGAAFFGESMFTRTTDASKVAFVHLAERAKGWGFHFVDCQMRTEHLATFGAVDVPREEFLERLAVAVGQPTREGSWAE